MSEPTIITIVHADDDGAASRLNASLVDRIGIYGRLARVDVAAPDWDAATTVHIGSFNHLDVPRFMDLVRTAGWSRPGQLQVFIRRQDDPATSEYDLFDEIDPDRIAGQAVGRGVGLAAPEQQSSFFDRLRSMPHRTGDAPATAVETTSPWLLEVVAIRPPYGYEANTRYVWYDQSTALDTSRYCVSPVDLAFAGVGVRWGSNRPDVLDSVDRAVGKDIARLDPGDIVLVEGRFEAGPRGIVDLTRVRSFNKRD